MSGGFSDSEDLSSIESTIGIVFENAIEAPFWFGTWVVVFVISLVVVSVVSAWRMIGLAKVEAAGVAVE